MSFIAASTSSFLRFGFKIPIPSLFGALVVLRVVLAVIFDVACEVDVVDELEVDGEVIFFVVGLVGSFLDSRRLC